MTTFFIGDTHFGHKNIISFDGIKEVRNFHSIEEHDEALIQKWNAKVGKQDVVWHLGDFCFGSKNIEIAGRLKGQKKLVLGNHDLYPTAEYLKYFDKLYGCATIKGFILSHVPVHQSQLVRFGRNIHGHLHNQSMGMTSYINVSAEQIGLAPIALEELPQ